MNKSIYQIAVECKEFSKKNVQYYNQMVKNTKWFCVFGANKYFEKLLLSLCEALSGKYPYIAEKLKEHTLWYDSNPVIHQSAIDEFVNYIINLEKPTDSDKKIFISHSSKDEVLVNGFIEKILMLGCGFKSSDIFCTLDHTAIRTGEDFRNEITSVRLNLASWKNRSYVC